MYEWNKLPWRKLEKQVFKLQKRIYRASQRGDVKTVHRLQKLLLKSWSAKCLAVRKVTQDNQGKKTAGVDGIKNLTPQQRLLMVNKLKLTSKASLTRRVWIPKPGKAEKRPLGIPTMEDRARQGLAKLALEPEWEARFEPNSYGFRPGRGCHDAIDAIFKLTNRKPKYVLDADVEKCFDRINHEALVKKIGTFPLLRRALCAWLKAGVLDGDSIFPTQAGTPQGGVISPLLANIALHGLERTIQNAFPATIKRDGQIIQLWKPQVIRYADDLVVIHQDLSVIQKCQEIINQWLHEIGLTLKPEKTRITHTLDPINGQAGFDFLGFNVRQYRTTNKRNNKGFHVLIKPSQESIKRHYHNLSVIVERHKAAPQRALIDHLNPVIRGWCNYYSTAVSKRLFAKLDHMLFNKLKSWAKRRHSQKSSYWAMDKYWGVNRGLGWTFCTTDKAKLLNHSDTPIIRHIKVKGTASPYDGDWSYWASRTGKHPELPSRVAKLLKQQKGKCPFCGLYFGMDDLIEVHHKDQNRSHNQLNNLVLLHRHCHDQIHNDITSHAKGTHDKSHSVEEPDEGKLSCPVLKTSSNGDIVA